MGVHDRMSTTGVACASVSLSLRDPLRSRGYARREPRPTYRSAHYESVDEWFQGVHGCLYQGTDVCVGLVRTGLNRM
jgi:hypothetical protein